MIRYFGVRNEYGMFDEIFAVSDDDRAVRFNYTGPSWRPLTPSRKLARKVSRDASLVQLDAAEVERVFRYIDPPRNFSLEWRVGERWGGWITVGLLFFPAIPLWFVWEDFLRWTGGYSELVVGVVTIAQLGLILGFRDRLTEAIVNLAVRLAQRRWKKSGSGIRSDLAPHTDRLDIAPPLGHAKSREKSPKIDARPSPEGPTKPTEHVNSDTLPSPESKADPYLDNLIEQGRMAGMDPEKLRAAFKDVGAKKLRELEGLGDELAAMDRKLKLQGILRAAKAFGSTDGYYVEHRGRTFFHSVAENSWTQLFPGTVPRDAVELAIKDLQALVFDEASDGAPDHIAQFVRLALDAVKADQSVKLTARLPDGSETSVRLHAGRWAGLLLGFPLIDRDKAPERIIEWQFNDYPGNATIYRVRDDAADPLEPIHEVNWTHLPRTVLETGARAASPAEHSHQSEHEMPKKPNGVWTVYVDDNFHYMDADERYRLGSFDSYEASVEACQKIVDDFLEANPATSADQLFESFAAFGEDPWIEGEPPSPEQSRFSAWDYAKRRCREIHRQH